MNTDITDNPELLATFTEEARERLDSLAAGLLKLESGPPSRSAISALFRDAHTLKGSARMLGLAGLVELAHEAESVMSALRDRRLTAGSELVDLLLAAVDGMARSLPSAAVPLDDDDRSSLCGALQAVLAGKPAGVPRPRVARVPDEPKSPALAEDPVPPAPQPVLQPAALQPAPVETVRVAVSRIHDLLDTVGEAEVDARRVERAANELAAALVAASRRLAQGREQGGALEGLLPAAAALRELVEDHAARVARLRSEAMNLAMVPLARLVAGFPRLVRDLAARTGKRVTLKLEGEDVELDKRVLDTVGEALGHLVTNAVDHGCESPQQRLEAGKSEEATVSVRARASGASVIIEVSDDGGGIDRKAVYAAAVAAGIAAPKSAPDPGTAEPGADALDHIFAPALSTRQTVSESSGRGVGLDVVRATVEGLGGQIEVSSETGKGTRFTLTLPVSLGVLRCLLCRVGAERYAIPLPSVTETVLLRGGAAVEVINFAGADLIIRDGTPVPLLDLAGVLGSFTGSSRANRSLRKPSAALITTSGRRPLAWAVDGLDGEADLVVTDLGPFLSGDRTHDAWTRATGAVAGASGIASAVTGASILDDGTVICLLDLRSLASVAGAVSRSPARLPAALPPRETAPSRALRILVVEDSVGVRELERSLLAAAGYAVDTAVDGVDGASKLTGEPYDLVVTDVEMPGLDGLALTRMVRATPGWQAVPVVVMTSRDSEADRRAGMDAGADAYLHKSDFSADDLLGTVSRLLGGIA
jgi:chemotaxis protein histidine kinase CheA